MKIQPLPNDPYVIFRGSRTPPGLYARQKWLDEGLSRYWRKDFDLTVSELFSGQAKNGSWHDSPLKTIRRLFGLHLTVRQVEPQIEMAMEWLLENSAASWNETDEAVFLQEQMRGLPFTSTRRPLFLLPATLFLATIFGKHVDNRVDGLYAQMIGFFLERRESWRDAKGIHNVLRALVVHPLYANNLLTRSVVDWLGDRQTPRGDWGHEIPFYQALNALAHLDAPGVNDQLEPAFAYLSRMQDPDGTWDGSEKEWNTFMAVHALRNRHLL
jgi:hypothetical protein